MTYQTNQTAGLTSTPGNSIELLSRKFSENNSVLLSTVFTVEAVLVHTFRIPDDVILDEIERPEIGLAGSPVQLARASVSHPDMKTQTCSTRGRFSSQIETLAT